jgi:PAS domain S-box-containing protein
MKEASAPPPGRAPLAPLANGAWDWDVIADVLRADARFASLTGLDPAAAAVGGPGDWFFHGVVLEDLLRLKIAVAAVKHGAESFARTYRVRDAEGVVRWVAARGQGESDASGKVTRFRGELSDVTEFKRLEQRLHVAQTAGGVGAFEHVDGFGTATVSEQFCRLLGLHPASALAVRTINSVVHPDDPAIIRTGEAPSGGSELRIRRADTGEERWIARRGERRADSVGGGPAFIGVIYDITDLKRTQEQLQDLTRTLEAKVEERTRERDRIWRRSLDLIAVLGRDGALRSVNPAWAKLIGQPEAAIAGRPIGHFVHPEDAAALTQALADESPSEHLDLRLRDAEGAWRRLDWTFVPEGDAIYATGRDVTERRHLEEQLRQSQKMEAVGQLTGGIAHDFNNMLTGIIGGLELAKRRLNSGRTQEAFGFMDAVAMSAQRAAALTHRLLAFSRRQTLNPQEVDVGALVRSMEDLLRRTLGESVELIVHSAEGLWPARCDANQLESALLNLAINARDAMPDGGRLAMACANHAFDHVQDSQPEPILPGDYVVVSVSDTGVGMAEAVKAKVFDPFFTTKPIGKGTGLGLSMVYGFVRQSGGHVGFDSELGAGTTIRLYLPRLVDASAAAEAPKAAGRDLQSLGENVLVVEDDAQVKIMLGAVLADFGYSVREAVDAESALAVLRSDATVHLLITDVGLPGMNGRQLAEFARELRPELPVLFVTGYVADPNLRADFLEPGMHMISKPFDIEALGSAVREALDGARG